MNDSTRLPRLAEIRARRGLSQRRLAVMARLHASSIGALEAGHVRAYRGWREQIAAALGIKPEEVDWTPAR